MNSIIKLNTNVYNTGQVCNNTTGIGDCYLIGVETFRNDLRLSMQFTMTGTPFMFTMHINVQSRGGQGVVIYRILNPSFTVKSI